jgi:hypothetical protein
MLRQTIALLLITACLELNVNAVPSWFGNKKQQASKASANGTAVKLPAELTFDSKIDKVMTIVFENEDGKKVMDDPFFGTELPKYGVVLTNVFGVIHPSQPNYIAMIAGDTLGVKSDNTHDLEGVSYIIQLCSYN